MNAVVVTGGGPEVGMGHVYESLTLADELSDTVHVEFLLYCSEVAEAMIEERGYDTDTVSSSADIAETVEDEADTVIVDLHDAPRELFERLEQLPVRSVAIGNPGLNIPRATPRFVDVLVNYTDGLASANSEAIEAVGRIVLRGPRYFLLRPEFREVGLAAVSRPPETLFVMFGGSDPSGLTLQALRQLGDDWNRIVTVVGPGSTRIDDVLSLSENRPAVDVYHDIDDVGEKMSQSDFVLTSPGASTFEALSLGLPTLAFYQNDLQAMAYSDVPFAHPREHLNSVERLVRTCRTEQYRPYHTSVGRGFDDVVAAIEGRLDV